MENRALGGKPSSRPWHTTMCVPWSAILREYVGGVYCGLETDDCGVCGNPPDFTRMQAGGAEEGSSTTQLVVGATDGLGRQRDNWLR
jgi:hypothetical protein